MSQLVEQHICRYWGLNKTEILIEYPRLGINSVHHDSFNTHLIG